MAKRTKRTAENEMAYVERQRGDGLLVVGDGADHAAACQKIPHPNLIVGA
jgi:hypothetical protein